MTTIVIDPGHGGERRVGGSSANNAMGPTGLLEKSVTLDLGLRLRDALQQNGCTVLLTRDTDVNLGLAARAHLARDNQADGFVSIHFNAPPRRHDGSIDRSINGTALYIHQNAADISQNFAQAVKTATLQATNIRDRGVNRARFGVLNPASHSASTAACLVEVSFLTNTEEERRLRDAAYLDSIAQAMAQGISQYFVPAVQETRSRLINYRPIGRGDSPARATASSAGPKRIDAIYETASGAQQWPYAQRALFGDANDSTIVTTIESFDIWHEVPLVPQLTGMSCWAAAAAMLVGWRNRIYVDPEEVAQGSGYWASYREGLLPTDVPAMARAFGLTLHSPQTLTVDSLRDLLQTHGPLWVGEASPGLHSVVLVGMCGDGSEDGTRVRINDPWPQGHGSRYQRSFRDMMRNFNAAANMENIGLQILYSEGGRGASSVQRRTFEERRSYRDYHFDAPA